MRCILINLKRAKARREAMAAKLHDLGIDYEIMQATDWQRLTDEDWKWVDIMGREKQGRFPLPRGAIACAISHHRALTDMIENGDDMVAVFEDDIAISPELGQVLASIEHTDHEFDIIFLHWNRMDKAFIPVCRLCNHCRLGIVKFSDWGAQGYVITRKAALGFLKYFPRVVHHADHALHACWEHGLQTFTLDPPVVSRDNVLSKKSFLGESGKSERLRTPITVARRIRSILVEDIRKRWEFYHRTKKIVS